MQTPSVIVVMKTFKS